MSVPFSRTSRSLASDGSRLSTFLLVFGGAGLLAWVGWLLLARVTVYETSTSARIEVDQAALRLRAPVSGRIEAVHLELGEEVEPGEVLIELNVEALQARLEGERERLSALTRQLEVIERELAAQSQATHHEQESSDAARAEAQARSREADARARASEEDAARLQSLWQQGQVSQAEAERARAQATQDRAAADALAQASRRSDQDRRTQEAVGVVRSAEVEREAASLQEQYAEAEATVRVLEREIAQHVILSPLHGRVGEVNVGQVGTFVDEGQDLGALIPDGELGVVAEFPPHAALGRMAPGQKARIRLDGFPWAEFGTLGATVSKVAGEVRDGMVRVELCIDADPPSGLPLQHGLPGVAEVEVDEVTPATLLLRATGQLLASSGSNRTAG